MTDKPTTDKPLDFAEFRTANLARCEDAFHPIDTWNLLEWGGAAAGELGEACNIAKKILRGDHLFVAHGTGRPTETAKKELADELADAVTYIDLMAARAGIDLGEAVRVKFNIVSIRRDSDIRL